MCQEPPWVRIFSLRIPEYPIKLLRNVFLPLEPAVPQTVAIQKLLQRFAPRLNKLPVAVVLGHSEKVATGRPNRIGVSYSHYQVSVCCLAL